MSTGPRHKITSWCLLGAVVIAFAVVIAIGIYVATMPGNGPQPISRDTTTETPRAPAPPQ